MNLPILCELLASEGKAAPSFSDGVLNITIRLDCMIGSRSRWGYLFGLHIPTCPRSLFPLFHHNRRVAVIDGISNSTARYVLSFACSHNLTGRRSIELIDKCIGSRIWVIMKSEREFTGTLLGFDDFVSAWNSSCSSFASLWMPCCYLRYGTRRCHRIVRVVYPISVYIDLLVWFKSEITPQGRKATPLAQTLLNGNNICMVSIRWYPFTLVVSNYLLHFAADTWKCWTWMIIAV